MHGLLLTGAKISILEDCNFELRHYFGELQHIQFELRHLLDERQQIYPPFQHF